MQAHERNLPITHTDRHGATGVTHRKVCILARLHGPPGGAARSAFPLFNQHPVRAYFAISYSR